MHDIHTYGTSSVTSRLSIAFDSSETEIASMAFLLGASAQTLGGAVLVLVDF